MKRDLVWFLAVVAVVLLGNLGRSGGEQQPQEPLTDERFCADANGDGVVNIADPVTILSFLFSGTATPYCVAEGVSLDELSAQLEALASRIDALETLTHGAGIIATGTYDGDDAEDRSIETGLEGRLRFVRIWQVCSPIREHCTRDSYTDDNAKLDTMPGATGSAGGDRECTIAGSSFVVDRSGNWAGFRYVWLAIATPE
jgi:hypothetical protein